MEKAVLLFGALLPVTLWCSLVVSSAWYGGTVTLLVLERAHASMHGLKRVRVNVVLVVLPPSFLLWP